MTNRFHTVQTTIHGLQFHLEAIGENEDVIAILPDTNRTEKGAVLIVIQRTDRPDVQNAIPRVGSAAWCDAAERAEWAFMAQALRDAIEHVRPVTLTGLNVARTIAEERAKAGWRQESIPPVGRPLPASGTDIAFQTGQLRHAYQQLKSGTISDHAQFADGLIAPVVQLLESLSPS